MESNRNPQIDSYIATLIRCRAWRLVGKAGLTNQDVDDLIQELTAELLKALPQFDPSRAGFKTYASCVVKCKASHIVRDRLAEKRNPARESHSLNRAVASEGPMGVLVGDPPDVYNRRTGSRWRSVEEQAQLALDTASVLAKLPAPLRRLCEALKKYSPSETARRLGIARSTVYVQIGKVKCAFEQASLSDYLK